MRDNCGHEKSDAKNTCGTCRTITLLNEIGESMRTLVKEKSSMVMQLKMICDMSLFVFSLVKK